jgi:hypothetical protein
MEEEEGSSTSSVAVPVPPPPNKYDSWTTDPEELMMMMVDEAAVQQEGPRRRRDSMLNKLISTVYSGPTISDIESALSFTGGGDVDARNYNNSSAGPGYVRRLLNSFSQSEILERLLLAS